MSNNNSSDPVDVEVEYGFTLGQIDSLLRSAFGSHGIGYWARVEAPDGAEGPWDYVVIDTVDGGKRYQLSLSKIVDGLALCAKGSPRVFARIACGDIDGPTADIVVQIATLGEVRYS